MKKNLKNLFLGLLIFLLFLPQTASADFLGIMEGFIALLEGVEEPVLPVFQQTIRFLFLYAMGIILLLFSGTLLQHVIAHQAAWISVQPAKNALVASGFAFTSGLANLLLILIFIVIVFAFIFKIETFQAKKALFRLIMVALLLNFSLVFMGMALDISNIIYSYILDKMAIQTGASGGGSLFVLTIKRIVKPTWEQLVSLIAWLGWQAGLFFVPISAAAAQLAIILTFESVFLPNILTWVSQLVSIYLVAGIFFLYTFVFISRVYIIQFLAILSPLAFLCLILPQTKKYWDEWLEHFLQWLFVGVFLLFFLVLGLRAMEQVMPPGSVQHTQFQVTQIGLPPKADLPLVSWFYIQNLILYYFCLFIYLLVVGWFARRTMPTLAKVIIQQATAWGGRMWTGVVKPMAGAFWRQAGRAAVEEAVKEERTRVETEAKGEKFRPSLGMRMTKSITTGIRWAYRVRGVTPELVVGREIEADVAELEKKFGKDTKSAIAAMPWKIADPYKKAALLLYLTKTKGAKGINQLSKERQVEAVRALHSLTPQKLVDVIKHKPELIEHPELGPIIQNAMVKEGLRKDEMGRYADRDVNKLIELGFAEAKAIKWAAFKKAVDALTAADIEKLDISTLDHPVIQEIIARFRTDVSFIRRIGEEKGQEYIDKIRDRVQQLGAGEIARTNMNLLRSSVVNPGFRAIFPPIEGAETRDELRKLEILAREPLLLEFDARLKEYAEHLKKLKAPETKKEDREKIEEKLKETWERGSKIGAQIETTPKLKRKWEEIVKLNQEIERSKREKRS